MKTFSIKVLMLSLVAILTIGCSSGDGDIIPDSKDFIGQWTRTIIDPRVPADGSITYTFNSNSTCVEETYIPLAKPGEQNRFYRGGKWEYMETFNGKNTLFIQIIDNGTVDNYQLEIVKYDKSNFKAHQVGTDIDYIFKRVKND